MPLHGRLWRWSDSELEQAALALAQTPVLVWPRYGGTVGTYPAGTFTMQHVARVAEAITQVRHHSQGLRHALLMTERITVVDRRNPHQFLYRVRDHDGQQAQRATPAAD